jgi:hypothetical protein
LKGKNILLLVSLKAVSKLGKLNLFVSCEMVKLNYNLQYSAPGYLRAFVVHG